MNPRVINLATSPHDGAGIAMCRQRAALLKAGFSSRLLCAVMGEGSSLPEAAVCPRDRVSILARIGRKLLGIGDRQETAERSVASALRAAARTNAFELFSTPYSRFSPQNHPWLTEADVVHLHWVASFVDYPRFFKKFQKPIIWTLHDQGPYLGGFHYEIDRDTAPDLGALDNEFLRIKKQAVSQIGDRLIVVGNSCWNTERAKSSGFFPSGTRFETIYYPLDTKVYSPVEKTAAKLALGIPPSEFTIGFACTSLDNPRKGFDDLVAPLTRLGKAASTSRPLSLVSFGRLPLSATRESVGIPWHQFPFLEADTQKAKMYSAMDCFIIPSRAEAFGQTAIEAMACGTPVIGARTGGIAEALGHGAAGLLYSPGDANAITDLVLHLKEHQEEANALAIRARAHVIVQHASERCASAYQALYRDIRSYLQRIPL